MFLDNEQSKTLCESVGLQQLQSHLYLSAKQCATPIPQPDVSDWRHQLAADVILRNVPNHGPESVVWALEFRAGQQRNRGQFFTTGGEIHQPKGDPHAL